MKTKNEIAIAAGEGSRRGPSSPTAALSLPLPTKSLPTVATATREDPNAIRPFRVSIPQSELGELRRRIEMTRWPEGETVKDASQGVQLATMRKLAQYWAEAYDWRKIEARLNSYPQFITEIDGLDIHFIHVRSKHAGAMPMIVTHGWPGSVVEQIKIIDPLTDPTEHGGSASEAFHVVIPSMPGYGFSGKPATTGWGPDRIARAWTTLMKRLGYSSFVAQGGDWGALVTQVMAVQAPPELVAIHTNMPGAVPDEIMKALPTHTPPANLAADEKRAFERLDLFFSRGLAYAEEMGKRPQTLYGIADSPIGLAAWFLDHDILSYEVIARVFDGTPEGLTRDDVLDNITIAWLTNTGISGARLYWENKLPFFSAMGIRIPVAVSAYPDELYQCPRSWAERAFPKLIHYNKLPKGGHFAAWEQPQLFVDELRAAFTSHVLGAPAAQPPSTPSTKTQRLRFERRSPSCWRVTFTHPPLNIFGPEGIPELEDVIEALESDGDVKVVVFDSAVEGFFLTHYDFLAKPEDRVGRPPTPTGLQPLPDLLVRLSRAPVVSIASIRGRATGVGSELALACDMRFASRERAILSQWEVGAGLVPGGGPMARLPRLIGRGRALEVLMGADDICGEIAELYGYVNRSLPDTELDSFVDALSLRIASFDKRAISDTKRLVNIASLPADDEIAHEWDAFLVSLQRPDTQARIKKLMDRGFHQPGDAENRLGHYVGQLGI